MVDTSDEWIVSRTGIKERRVCENGMVGSDMAVIACQKALDNAGVSVDDVDILITATVTPDYRLPSQACIVQNKLGANNAAALDVVAACAGYINGLSIARSFIESGMYKNILVVGVEYLTSITDYTDRGTCILFGDGAGATLITAETDGNGVVSTYLKSDGRLWSWLTVEAGACAKPSEYGVKGDGSDKIYMNGSDIFKVAVREMTKASIKVLEDAGITADDVSLVVPHQANIRIIDAIVKRLKIDKKKVFLNIEKYGNTSAASVPLALDEANHEGLLHKGDYVLMVAFGGGLTTGAALLRW